MSLPAAARFCPECGTAVAEPPPVAVSASADRVRDPAEALLSARDVDGVEDEPPAPEDMELVERVREDRARARTVRRSVLVAGVALLVFGAALALAMRAPRSSPPASAPAEVRAPAPVPDVEKPRGVATAAPAPRATTTLPPRAARPRAKAEAPRAVEEPSEPAAMPSAVAPQPPVRVEVSQTPNAGAMDYSVRVSGPDGAPVTDADVRLRGVMTDGALVEARLEPGREPGVYQSLLAFSPRGPRALTVRVRRADGVVEVPVADPQAGSPARP